MNEVVLDASALLAVLLAEPGTEDVEPHLERSIISAVNLSEVAAKLIEDGMPEVEIRRAVGGLGLAVDPFDTEQAYVAGALRGETRALGLSFGDRACLALAKQQRATALTADRSWLRVELGIRVQLIR